MLRRYMGDDSILFYRNKSKVHERHKDGMHFISSGKSVLTDLKRNANNISITEPYLGNA